MSIKNVVIVNDRSYIEGGSDKVAIQTAEELAKRGINVIFFAGKKISDAEIEGIQYIYTNQEEALKEKNILKGIINGIYNFKARKELKKVLKALDSKETIIHVHGWTKVMSSSIFNIAFKMKFEVVLTLHDYFLACPNGAYFNFQNNNICTYNPLSMKCIKCNCDSRNYIFKLYRVVRQFVQNKVVKLNSRLKNVITISEFSEKILINTLGKDSKIMRIYNPIDKNEISDESDNIKKDYYLYVGRIAQEKGVDIFCKAITELSYKGIVVGDGKERERLQREYPNIKFTGWKSKEEVKQYMKEATALIFPSIWYETAGLTVLEAQELGTPCIVNSNTAASEFLTYGNTYDSYDDLKKCLEEKNYFKKEREYEDYITNLTKYFEEILMEK